MAKVNSISVEGDVITFETIGAETLRVNPFAYSPEIQRQLIILGAKTRIGNASHMERNPETGLSATPREKAEAMRAVHETLLTGEWSARKVGGGAGREAGITLRALAEVQGLPVEAMRQRIDQPGMSDAVTGVERQFQGSIFLGRGWREDFANPVGNDLEAVIAGNGRHPFAPPTGQIGHDDFGVADKVNFRFYQNPPAAQTFLPSVE